MGAGPRQVQEPDAKALMMSIIDGRPYRDKGPDVTWWDWLKGLGLWVSVTGLDAKKCDVELGWGLARRCCPVPGTMTK